MLGNLPNVLWNPVENRLRAGVRIVIFFALWGGGPALAHLLIGESVRTGLNAHWSAGVLLDLTRLALVLVAGWLVARFVDHRPFVNYGFHLRGRWWLDLGFGVALGALLMTGVFLTLRAANWIVVESVAPLTSPSLWEVLVAPLVLSIVVAVSEELLARGDQTLNLSEGLRPLGRRQAVLSAWLLSSLSFGALHFLNPNSTWMSTAYLVIYGLLLGVGYILTGELAISIGLHFAWNYVQGAVFGFPVSGRSLAGVSILVTQERGPDLWTGGAFGPEAGLVAVLSALVGAALIALWVRWRYGRVGFGQLYANMWREQ